MVFFLLLFQEAKQIASGFHVAEEDRAALGEAGKDTFVQFDKVRTLQHGWGALRRLGWLLLYVEVEPVIIRLLRSLRRRRRQDPVLLYVEVEHIIRPVMIPS